MKFNAFSPYLETMLKLLVARLGLFCLLVTGLVIVPLGVPFGRPLAFGSFGRPFAWAAMAKECGLLGQLLLCCAIFWVPLSLSYRTTTRPGATNQAIYGTGSVTITHHAELCHEQRQ